MTLAMTARTTRRRLPRSLDVASAAVLVLVALCAFEKLTFVLSAPLWLDEVWTGVIASQRTVSGFAHQCYLDVGAPLGYVVAWLWSMVAGLSDEALRFPSRLFASITPLIALAAARPVDRTTKLVWCGLLACWLPGLFFSIEARTYPLVMMLATASTVAFVRLMTRPSLKAAWAWTSLSGLLILAHYVSGILVACEGLAYLATCRFTAVRTWPAALAFLPAAASLAVHAALLLGFSHATGPGPPPIQPGGTLEFFAGGSAEIWVLLSWAAVSLVIVALRRGAVTGAAPTASEGSASAAPGDGARLWVVPGASLAAVALCLLISMWRPIIPYRYLTAMTPPLLLGVAMLAGRLERYWRLAPAVLLAVYAGVAAGEVLGSPKHSTLFNYEFETPSDALMAANTRRLVFMWDIPSATAGDPDAFGQVGGFFFKRAGRPIPVDWTPALPGRDPSAQLLARAAAPGTAILWLYDPAVVGTVAAHFPPHIQQLDPRWGCRDFGDRGQHVLACSRAWGLPNVEGADHRPGSAQRGATAQTRAQQRPSAG
jgi:hypothetical protein